MEEELLKDMIQERDKKISQLKVKLEVLEEKIERGRKELQDVRAQSSESKLVYRREIAELVKKRDDGLVKIQKMEKEVRNQNGSLHGYAEILKEATPESVDSSYVVRMQSQLCKAMHSMGMLEHQLGIVNEISSEVIKTSKEAISGVVDEKTKMELEIMNELMAMDDQKRKAEEECKENLEKEQLQVVALRKQLGEFDEDKSDHDSDDEAADEEEMREALEELKDVIAEMVEENAEQLKTIQKLRAQLGLPEEKSEQAPQGEQVNGNVPPGEESESAPKEGTSEEVPETNASEYHDSGDSSEAVGDQVDVADDSQDILEANGDQADDDAEDVSSKGGDQVHDEQ